MARCANCGSLDADVDWGVCYDCFVASHPPQPKPTIEEECAAYGYAEYAPGEGRCYCGQVIYENGERR